MVFRQSPKREGRGKGFNAEQWSKSDRARTFKAQRKANEQQDQMRRMRRRFRALLHLARDSESVNNRKL
jgi:hypothetical protein